MVSFLLVHHHGSKMLRSESNSSITQSPIGWQISHFLTMLHEPTCGMCVCTSERSLLALVSVCTTDCTGVCGCVCVCLIVSESTSHIGHSHVAPAAFHACTCVFVSHATCCRFLSGALVALCGLD